MRLDHEKEPLHFIRLRPVRWAILLLCMTYDKETLFHVQIRGSLDTVDTVCSFRFLTYFVLLSGLGWGDPARLRYHSTEYDWVVGLTNSDAFIIRTNQKIHTINNTVRSWWYHHHDAPRHHTFYHPRALKKFIITVFVASCLWHPREVF